MKSKLQDQVLQHVYNASYHPPPPSVTMVTRYMYIVRAPSTQSNALLGLPATLHEDPVFTQNLQDAALDCRISSMSVMETWQFSSKSWRQ